MSTKWTPEHEAIHHALNELCDACGYQGESGTEAFFQALTEAVHKVDWSIVEQSHKDGLCYDVNALLATMLVEVLNEHDRAGSS